MLPHGFPSSGLADACSSHRSSQRLDDRSLRYSPTVVGAIDAEALLRRVSAPGGHGWGDSNADGNVPHQ